MTPEALIFNCIMSFVGHGKRWHWWHRYIIMKQLRECSFHVVRWPTPTPTPTPHPNAHPHPHPHPHTLLWGVIIWYNEITLGVLISRCSMSHTHIWGVSIWYKEITLGVLPSCWKMTPTHHAIRSHRYLMHAFAKPLRGWKRGNLPWCNTYKSPFVTRREIFFHMWLTELEILHFIIKGFPVFVRKMAWDICLHSLSMRPYSLFCRSQINTPEIISKYQRITPNTRFAHIFVFDQAAKHGV